MNATTHGIQVGWMDRTANPGVDFNRYANGGWIDAAVIPDEYGKWGTFYVLRDNVINTLHAMFQRLAADTEVTPGSNAKKIGDFWASGMDEAGIEKQGAKPLAYELSRINSISGAKTLAAQVARMHLFGINVFFGFGSSTDYKDSTRQIATAGQGGLGLPERDYYLDTDEHSQETRAKYLDYVTRLFELIGERSSQARKHARAVLELETALAQASMGLVDQRSPEKTYHMMSVEAFEALCPKFAFGRYLQDLEAPQFSELNVAQPEFFQALNELLKNTSLRHIKAYLRFHLARRTASYLSSDFVNASFEFVGKYLQGSKALQPRLKRVIDVVNGALGDAVGQLYVAEVFPPEAKAKVLALVENIRAALAVAVEQASWMSDATKSKAHEKLAAFEAKIGYPDKWQDYSTLEVSRDSYVANVLRANEFASRLDLAKIGQPVDRDEWFMSPQTVNAYYTAERNQIVFPAAILQPPFFDPQADDAANYGGIGVVIGHEMTHGFDDQGSKFDAVGNLQDWWQEADRAAFMTNVARIVEQFSGYTVAGGAHVKGELVSGEAASDLGGVKLGLRALDRALAGQADTVDANGFNNRQRFFIAFAQLWAAKSRPEAETLQVKTDPHPPAQFRVNGTLANLPEYAEAFGLKECPLLLPAEKRCLLW